ncbi:MAG TPA: hypothetical protein VIZ90_12655 [Rhizobiaceae bacterium]
MGADQFMPGEGAIAGIRADIERYEAERGRAHRAVMWRVPVFDGLTLAAIFAIAWAFNNANIAHSRRLSAHPAVEEFLRTARHFG